MIVVTNVKNIENGYWGGAKVLNSREINRNTVEITIVDEVEDISINELFSLKNKKIEALLKAKTAANARVKTELGVFRGGRDSANKIDESYRLGKMAGLTVWEVADIEDNLITVDESQIKALILKIGSNTFKNWKKFIELSKIVKNAKSKDEIAAINWIADE